MIKKWLYLLGWVVLLCLVATCSPKGKFIFSIERNTYYAAVEVNERGEVLRWAKFNCGDCHASDSAINAFLNKDWSTVNKGMRDCVIRGSVRPHVSFLKQHQAWDAERNSIPF